MKWKLLAKYLAGETNEKENHKIQKWMNKNSENGHFINDLKTLWGSMESKKEHIDVDKAWNKLRSKIQENESQEKNKSVPVFSLNKTVVKYAASIVLIIGIGALGMFSYQRISNSWNTVNVETSAFDSNKEVTLPDGSIAYLNKKSEVNYPKSFQEGKRSIKFEGEGFFDIEKDPNKPFIIEAGKAQIEVLGTSFNVNTHSPDRIEVFVKSGTVKLSSKSKGKSIIINKGYIGTLSGDKLTKKLNKDVNYLSWRTGKLIFKKTKIEDAVKALNRTYDVRIVLENNSLKNEEITATFDQEPIEHVLKVIGKTFGVKIQAKDNTYIIGEENS
jgi:ferric-dicitrate binding protein FerR (iron transport regulator)